MRLVFNDRAAALPEHIADRFNQVRDNWGFLVEEHTASKREGLYRRVFADLSDLLRVDPDNGEARRSWADIDYRHDNMPQFHQPVPPDGHPHCAFPPPTALNLLHPFPSCLTPHHTVTH